MMKSLSRVQSFGLCILPLVAACSGDQPAGSPADTTDATTDVPLAEEDAIGEATPTSFGDEADGPARGEDALGDAGIDALFSDAASRDAIVDTTPPPGPYPRPTYQHLAETGLLDDVASLRVVDGALPFEPAYKLWSDGATKRRWIVLPPGTQIDTSDMDHWVFPIGTKFFKEFSLDKVPLETRLIERYGAGPEDYWMGAFVWNDDGTDAELAVDGQENIRGTMHDAPAQKDCGACHRGDTGRVLGFSAIQMSSDSQTPNLHDLAARGWLSAPPEGGIDYPAPGDTATSTALGYLHANCGHCHNENGTAWPDTQMVLRLRVTDRDAASSGVFASIVGKPVTYWRGGAITLRVAPGQPDMSAITVRMQSRGTKDQMPALATEIVDPTGIEAVRAWISSLSP
jgi:hypothetical protein